MYRPLILIVDDDPGIQDMLNLTLAMNGYDTLISGNGIDALGIMTLHRPDAILLDVNMPCMDGVKFTQELELLHLRTCPIVVLTASYDKVKQQRIAVIQPEAIVLKPFHLDELLDTLERLIVEVAT